MDELTEKGRAAVEAAALRNGFGPDAALALLHALAAGHGVQAQFSHPELGGMGQWSQGGMLMIGDMFNNGLKARVAGLAADLAPLATDPAVFAPVPSGRRGGADWWPEGLGRPSSVGAQNEMRYAVFPETRRLVVDTGGRIAVYDTGDHLIGGASQQQGGARTLSFSSQLGPVGIDALRRVDAAPEPPPAAARPAPPATPVEAARAQEPAPAQPAAPAPAGAAPAAASSAAPGTAADPLSLIERMAELHRKGILSDAEFAAKKAELLSRL